MKDSPCVEQLDVSSYRIPTDTPESDGTLKWDHTCVVVVNLTAGGTTGLGWTYAASAAAGLIDAVIRDHVAGKPAMEIEGMWQQMNHALRNAGVPGVGSMAVAAVDIALWDLQAKLLETSLVDLFGRVLRMLQAGAVDCIKADATRCGGYTGFLKIAALCEAFQMPLSAHCAPQLHAHVGCAASVLRHVEYFHDHTRIDHMLFEGSLEPKAGLLHPDRSRLGHGLHFKSADAMQYRQ